MKLQELVIETVNFDEKFIRDVAKDAGVDLSGQSTAQIKKMHQTILDQAEEMIDDPDMGLSREDIGQEYYDQTKQYFSH